MENIQIFNNPEFGEIRTVIIDGEPWFVGNDVAGILKYKDKYSALRKNVDEDDKRLCPVGSTSGIQETTVINESGLYSLIFGSKLETAKRFKRWVTSEILPQIRKTGRYERKEQVKKISQDIPVGELARLSSVMDRIMVRQQSKPHEIAHAFEMLCGQFGIALPENFVNIPEYEQMELKDILVERQGGAANE